MIIAKVGRRGQITIPREVRRWLNLEEGAGVAFIRRQNEVVLQPLTRTLLNLRGSVPVPGPQDFDAIRAQVIRDRAQRVGEGDA